MAIKSLISSKFIELEDTSTAQICVCLQKALGNTFIFNIYIPPQSPLAVYKAQMDNIVHITNGLSFPDSVIVLVDDLHLDCEYLLVDCLFSNVKYSACIEFHHQFHLITYCFQSKIHCFQSKYQSRIC